MKCIYLDDVRTPEQTVWVQYPKDCEFIIVRNYDDFCEIVDNLNSLDGVLFSFDHDIQDFTTDYYDGIKKELTGYDCAKYLVECMLENPDVYDYKHLKYVVHSKNPVGAANIEGLFIDFINHCEKENEPLKCDGCNSTQNVYVDSGNYNVCSNCTSYSVRGLSQSDFW